MQYMIRGILFKDFGDRCKARGIQKPSKRVKDTWEHSSREDLQKRLAPMAKSLPEEIGATIDGGHDGYLSFKEVFGS